MHLGTVTLPGRKGEDMSALRQLRNFWIPLLTTVVLACFSDAFAQTSYRVTDLGTLHDGYFGCTMGLNNRGWTETQYGYLDALGKLVKGRVAINVDRFTLDLGTLGGPNSWDNPFGGEINDRGEAVGYSETSVPDPDGEDICGFGTKRTCRPFLWRNGHMSALPTLGGNNGQASAINNRGQITGFAENGIVDSTCRPGATNNRIQLPVLWEKGQPQPLPTVDKDPDGAADAINDRGQVVGESGTCTAALHAVLWENGKAFPLPDFGTGATAFGINDRGQIVGLVGSSDGTTFYAALWQNGGIKKLQTLPGDFAAIASGINNKGQVVGSTLDSTFHFVARAFIWQDDVMTDLNTLFPEDSNLYATMANQINERGQITGMATVQSGAHKGETHAFLATPVNESIGKSVADVAATQPKLPADVGKQLFERFRLGRIGQ
jgi:probable HAF family extracellular repeat protein